MAKRREYSRLKQREYRALRGQPGRAKWDKKYRTSENGRAKDDAYAKSRRGLDRTKAYAERNRPKLRAYGKEYYQTTGKFGLKRGRFRGKRKKKTTDQ